MFIFARKNSLLKYHTWNWAKTQQHMPEHKIWGFKNILFFSWTLMTAASWEATNQAHQNLSCCSWHAKLAVHQHTHPSFISFGFLSICWTEESHAAVFSFKLPERASKTQKCLLCTLVWAGYSSTLLGQQAITLYCLFLKLSHSTQQQLEVPGILFNWGLSKDTQTV